MYNIHIAGASLLNRQAQMQVWSQTEACLVETFVRLKGEG